MDNKFEPGSMAILNNRDFEDEMVEVLCERGSGYYLVKVISHNFNYYAHKSNMILQHGVCVEQLTTRKEV